MQALIAQQQTISANMTALQSQLQDRITAAQAGDLTQVVLTDDEVASSILAKQVTTAAVAVIVPTPPIIVKQ